MRRLCLALALLLTTAMLSGCRSRVEPQPVQVLVDGQAWEAQPAAGDDLQVYITLDGEELAVLPFGEVHTVEVLQPDGAENTVRLTGEAVYMEHANCDNQDCVNMGEVTRDNYELRVMGGFIICLPHRVSVEVRGK